MGFSKYVINCEKFQENSLIWDDYFYHCKLDCIIKWIATIVLRLINSNQLYYSPGLNKYES